MRPLLPKRFIISIGLWKSKVEADLKKTPNDETLKAAQADLDRQIKEINQKLEVGQGPDPAQSPGGQRFLLAHARQRRQAGSTTCSATVSPPATTSRATASWVSVPRAADAHLRPQFLALAAGGRQADRPDKLPSWLDSAATGSEQPEQPDRGLLGHAGSRLKVGEELLIITSCGRSLRARDWQRPVQCYLRFSQPLVDKMASSTSSKTVARPIRCPPATAKSCRPSGPPSRTRTAATLRPCCMTENVTMERRERLQRH